MGVAATPKCKESAYWKNKESEEFGGFDYEFFYQHARFIDYNVTNTLHNNIEAGKGIWEPDPRKFLQMFFPQRWKIPLTKLIHGRQKNPLVEGLYGSIYLNLSGYQAVLLSPITIHSSILKSCSLAFYMPQGQEGKHAY